MRVHLAKAEEYWRADQLDMANEAMRRALKVGIPAGHAYNLQRTIEAEWGAREMSQRVRIHMNLEIEARAESIEWWDRLVSMAIASLHKVTDELNVVWSKPILITLFPFDDWVEFMHSRYGYYTDRETIHKICLPPTSYTNPTIFRRAVSHEITHAAVREIGGERVPRWFNEGLAVVMEGSEPTHPPLPKLTLKEISSGFESLNVDLRSSQASHCYALAGDFMNQLRASCGMERLRVYLARIGEGSTPEDAFEIAFRKPQHEAEREWRSG